MNKSLRTVVDDATFEGTWGGDLVLAVSGCQVRHPRSRAPS